MNAGQKPDPMSVARQLFLLMPLAEAIRMSKNKALTAATMIEDLTRLVAQQRPRRRRRRPM